MKKVLLRWLDRMVPIYARRIQNETGLTLLNPRGGLGTGRYGAVYATDDPRWVVKVSQDIDEGPLAQKIVEIRSQEAGGSGYGPSTSLPGIVFFRNIFRAEAIEHHCHTFRPYIIIRESVEPVNESDVERMTYWIDDRIVDRKKNEALSHPALDLVMEWAKQYYSYPNDRRHLELSVRKYVGAIEMVQEEFPLLASTLMRLFQEYSMILQDVRVWNTGWSTVNWGEEYRKQKELITYDVGMTPTWRQYRFEKLKPFLRRKLQSSADKNASDSSSSSCNPFPSSTGSDKRGDAVASSAQ